MIYTIADLHLSLSTNKSMEVFGDRWEGYIEKLKNSWQSKVGENDTVVIPGDISWAMKLQDALADFKFIEELNGKKIIFKGNHDYFWETSKKLDAFLFENGITSVSMLKNKAVLVEGKAICGTKGYWYDQAVSAEQNAKLLNREVLRLDASLSDPDIPGDAEKIVFLHYPPIYKGTCVDELINCMKKHGVKRCYYGHLHSAAIANAFRGEYEGINFELVSADSLGFCPLEI